MVSKSVRGRASRLLVHFSGREPPTFTVEEARDVLGTSPQAAWDTLARLVRQGWLVRARRGVYEVAPLWATPDSYTPDRYSALTRWIDPPYYVAYRSALELYGWLQHPVLDQLWVAVPAQRRRPSTLRDRITWVVTRAERFEWGVRTNWIGSAALPISDPERTFLDCLHLPRHAGGITDVADAYVRAWPKLDPDRLVAHAERLDIESVTRRLGTMTAHLELDGADRVLSRLPNRRWRGRPVLLDPSLPSDGPLDQRWGVRLNVSPDELAMAGRT